MQRLMRRAQAAMEFLTTYGWAFLVILVMVGSLTYFGVLDLSESLPSRCNFSPEFDCVDFAISMTDEEFRLKMKNNFGEPIVVTQGILGTETEVDISCTTEPTQISGGTTWGTGEIIDMLWEDCNIANIGFATGQKDKILVTLVYNSIRSGPTYSHEADGSVFATTR